ncbi:MAG: hypothetical protein IJC51_00915 [Eggerthellaceae bacterium]|nr:hypothetical protein [Eggerthellaceae bacterium]
MRFCLCGKSAIEFWRNYDNRIPGLTVFGHSPHMGPTLAEAFPSRKHESVANLEDFVANSSFILSYDLEQWGVDSSSVHVLARRGSRNSTSPRITVHTCTDSFFANAALVIDAGLCVLSPEHTILFSARDHDFYDTLLLGYEFCGCYSQAGANGKGSRLRHPLTSVNELKRVVESASKAKGIKTLRKATRFILDGSGSPQETAAALILLLPKRHGGYGLPAPRLNVNIVLDKNASLVWEKGNAFDMVWADERTVVEYDGEAGHTTFEQKERDSMRRNALVVAGYTVFVLTKSQLADVKKTYGIAHALAKMLKHRLSLPCAGFREKHLALRARMLSKHT